MKCPYIKGYNPKEFKALVCCEINDYSKDCLKQFGRFEKTCPFEECVIE